LSSGPASIFDKRFELLTERCGVLFTQFDLVLRAVDPESHRLIRRASIEIVY
jgi:hypothetical protein